MSSPTGLKRTIGFRDMALFYVASGLSIRWIAAAAAAGPSVLVVWIAALVCFFIPLAATVMELSSRYPQEGGMYIWAEQAFGEFAGFFTAWTYWMSNVPYFSAVLYFAAASTLFAFGERGQSLASSAGFFMIFSAGWLAIITLVNIAGLDLGKWLNNISSMGSILPLAIVIVLGAVSYSRFGSALHFSAATLTPHWSMKNAIFWSGVFFAFSGLESGSAMGDEIRNPRQTIPWAILAGGSIMAIGYIAGTAAMLVAVPANAMSGPDALVFGIRALSSHLGLAWLLAPMAVLVSLNGVGNAAAFLSSTSRLPFVAGIHNYLPPVFAKVHPRFRTPWVAIAVYGGAGIVMALLGQAGTNVRGAYDVLVSMAGLTTFLPYFFVFGALIRVQNRPMEPGALRIPGGRPVAIMLAVLGLASTLATVVLSTIPSDDDPHPVLAVVKILGLTSILLGAGVVVFLIARYKQKKLGLRDRTGLMSNATAARGE
ncbi:MAG TPA: APC family permease [Terracidiphilus sp.]|nr:APC family permease [Terracidiphilus sp.]